MRRLLSLAWVGAVLFSCACILPKEDDDDDDDDDLDPWDQDEDSDDGEVEDTDDTEDTDTRRVDSCEWPELGICFEFEEYADTETWCYDLASEYDLDVTYRREGCRGGAVALCALPAGGDIPVEATLYYYAPNTASEAEGACEDAGGRVL